MPPDTEVANIEQRTACAILGWTEGIQDVNLQRADIAAPVFGHVRTIEPIEGFLGPAAARRRSPISLTAKSLGAPQGVAPDVSVNVAARVGDFQGGRLDPLPVVLLAGMCMVEALAHHAFEVLQAGRAKRRRECSDHFAQSKVFVSRE
jgi:hypothetical protein